MTSATFAILSRSTASIVASAAMLMPAAAFAQLKPETETGSRVRIAPKSVEAREAGQIKKAFGQCIFQAAPGPAASVLLHSDPMATDFVSAGVRDMLKAFSMRDCLGEQAGPTQSALGFKFQQDGLRALLSEEAYLAGHRVAPTLPAGAVEAVERTFVSTADTLARAKSLAAFADCVVFTDVAHSDALLRTMPASPSELAAARALAPALGRCLSQGDQISFSPRNIRAVVADAMWNRFSKSAARATVARMKP